MSRAKRSTADYLASARKNSIFAPSLRKYKRRKKLKPAEKGAITRKENALKGSYNLKPLTKKQARKMRDVLYAPGVAAIQLSNTGEEVKIHVTEDKNMFVTTNGRTWVYWHLSELKRIEYDQLLDEGYSEEEARELVGEEQQGVMVEAGKKVFTSIIREAFPVEKIIRLAEKAFKKPHVHMIGLWTNKGRVGEGFRTFDEFKQWVFADFSTYANVEKWVNGVAILIAERGERINQNVWSTRTVRQVEADRTKRLSERRKQERLKRGKR
jgi:hypothetical protein